VRLGSGSPPRLCSKASFAISGVREPSHVLVTSFTLELRPSTTPDDTSPRARTQFTINGLPPGSEDPAHGTGWPATRHRRDGGARSPGASAVPALSRRELPAPARAPGGWVPSASRVRSAAARAVWSIRPHRSASAPNGRSTSASRPPLRAGDSDAASDGSNALVASEARSGNQARSARDRDAAPCGPRSGTSAPRAARP